MSIQAFPVRIVKHFNPENLTWRGRRGEGATVAEGVYRFGANPLTDVRLSVADNADKSISITANICENSLKQLFVHLKGDASLNEILEKLAACELNVFFQEGNESLLAMDSAANVLYVACDPAIATGFSDAYPEDGASSTNNEDRQGFELLLILGHCLLFLCWLGWSQRQALNKILDLYAAFSHVERASLQQLLEGNVLDSGNLFSIFLKMAACNSSEGSENGDFAIRRDRQITWLLGQDRLDLPYQRQAALDILNAEADVDEQRFRLYHLLRGYDRALERGNIERIADEVHEARQQLIFGRMSRAFHNQATLFANAVLLQPGPAWRPLAEELSALAKNSLGIQPSAMVLVQLLNNTAEIPLTHLEGACERFEQAVIDEQKQALADALLPSRYQVESHNDALIGQYGPILSCEAIMATAGQNLRLVERIRREFLSAPKRYAAYVVISQRPSPTGSHLLIKINEFQDPYSGKSDNLRKLIRLAGDRIYSSPDYGWLEAADHWIEAIPLFIKEEVLVSDGQETTRTVIDISGMEVSFREEMADLWAKNLTQVLESEFLCLARGYLSGGKFSDADDESVHQRLRLECDSGEIASLGVLLGEIYRRQIDQVQKLIELEELSPLDAMRQILLDSEIMREAEARRRIAANWTESVLAVLEGSGYCKNFEQEVFRLKPRALKPRRTLPTLHILTTQSAGMTEGYIRTWLEESMAIFNIVEDLGLHEKVAERQNFFTARILCLAEKVIRELGAWIEVEDLCAGEQISEPIAIMRLINRNRLIQDELSCLGTLIEFEELQKGRGQAEDCEEPKTVAEYLQFHAQALQEDSLLQVVARHREALTRQIAGQHGDNSQFCSDESLQRMVLEDEYYRQDILALTHSTARRRILEQLDTKHPQACLKACCDTYLRRFQQLRTTTARKEILAESGLNHLTLHPYYYFKASGGGKRYHLIYTPSRVDLGHRERESVETWSQWIGGADRPAAQAGRRIYSLINKDVRFFDSLTEPEILKTGENASMASHFGFSNALSLMVTASAHGDFEAMADLMNRRNDRYIHPAGEGYGGYCVPKDGLFLEFVLTLNRADKLRQIGLAESYHQGVIDLANRLLDRKPEFASLLEWEAWAAVQLQGQDHLKPYFSMKNGLPVFQITRIAQVLENLGKPEIRDHFRIASSLAAGWGLHKMVTGGEQVNRFMPFFKSWLIRQGVQEASRRHPQSAICIENCIVVLSAEYKPDTQDARFSTGLRKFEILTGIGGHLLNALDIDGQKIAVLMHDGFAGLEQRGWSGRILEMLNISADDHARQAQLHHLFPAAGLPAEIRLVSPMALSVQDLLNYTSDTQLEAIADKTRGELLEWGLTLKEIEANLRTWGARLSRWDYGSELTPRLKAAQLAHLGAGIHALALATLGPERSYEYAVQGADVIDTGIPHRSLLDLLADPAKLCRLMLEGNPNSALAIVDGAAGARHRAMNRDDVMLWFAAGERMGREPVYLSVGVGQQTVEAWRSDMRRRRQRAGRLWNALTGPSPKTAQLVYENIFGEVTQDQEIYSALAEIDKLQRFGRQNQQNRVLAELLGHICTGIALKDLSFADFLALGGIYQFLGATGEEIRAAMATFSTCIALAGGNPAVKSDESFIADLLRSQRPIKAADFREEKGIESSNKATEERAVVALETRRQLAKRIAKAGAFNQRQSGYASVESDDDGFLRHYHKAMQTLGAWDRPVSENTYGVFLGHTHNALVALANELRNLEHPEETPAMVSRLKQLFSGRQIDEQLYQCIAGGYEDIGDFGRLAQHIRERAQQGKIDSATKELGLGYVAQGVELFYIVLAIESTIAFMHDDPATFDGIALWRALSGFFAKTVNDHSYEYRPWIYSRGTGYSDLHGDSLYSLAVARHQWLYGYLRFMVTRYTELKELPCAEQDLLLGNYLDGNRVEGIGAGAYGEAEKIWRAYGQIRELAFIRNDGLPIPEVFAEFNPDLIHDRARVNHVIAAPVGRTHFSRALCEGPNLARELEQEGRRGGNIIITRKIDILEKPADFSRPIVIIDSGHFYMEADAFEEALVVHKGYSRQAACQQRAKRAHPKGIRIAANFTRPVLAALVYPFHGNPVYDSGQLEACGLPYTVQSLFHTWTTYDKTKYRDIFRDGDVGLSDEIAWLADYNVRESEKSEIENTILHGLPGTAYPGLLAFSRRHPLVMIKDATESGGRNAQAFALCRADGKPDRMQIESAVEFIYQISLRRHVCIQEVILSSPEYWATEEFMRDFVRRQIVEWGGAVNRHRHPHTSIFGSHRIILSTDNPDEPDQEKKWHISHWITLNSKQLITNLGRGGTLEQMLPAFIRPEHRNAIIGKLSVTGRRVMELMAAYQERCSTSYTNETGRTIGADLMGVSYGMPRYMMLDFLISPVFDREGVLVELEAVFDEKGNRTGSQFVLQQGNRIEPGNIVDCPPRPRPSSLPPMSTTSIPCLRSIVLVATLRS